MNRLRPFGVLLIILLAIPAFSGCGASGGGSSGPTTYRLNTTVENGPGCSVTPENGTNYLAGTVVTLVPSGATGYALDHWGGTNGPEVTAEGQIVMNGDKNIAAVFAKLNYALDVAADGHGSVSVYIVPAMNSSSYTVEHGQTVKLIPQPNAGYVFDHWEGGLTGSDNPATLIMTGEMAVTAHFSTGISGYVLGKDTAGGVAGITVTAGGLTATTNASGYWQLKGVSLPVTVSASVSAGSGYLGPVFSPATRIISSGSAQNVNFLFSGYTFAQKWGNSAQFDNPNSIALGVSFGNVSTNVYIADTLNQRIQRFDSNGAFFTSWGSGGNGNGQFAKPYGVVVDTAGQTESIYVVDQDNNRIQKFDSYGRYQSQWGGSGTGNGQFNQPSGIALDTFGAIYVVDTGNGRIQKFTSDGAYVTQFGSEGSGAGEFEAPYGVAVDASGYIYVADTSNNRIQKFTNNGTFVTQWGVSAHFNQPCGVAVDALGYVYVADTHNNLIQKFTADGTYVTQWGGSGTGDGQFDKPRGIAADPSGNVYVIDTHNNRIQKFTAVH